MRITLLGLVFLPLCLFYMRQPSKLLDLVFVGSAFNAAAVLVLGGFGISPNLVPTILFIGGVLLLMVLGRRFTVERQALRILLPLIITCCWALFSSMAMPRLFQGQVMVWPQKMQTYVALTPLAPNFGNVTQDLYLAVAFALAVCSGIYLTGDGINLRRVAQAYFAGGYTVAFIALWQFLGNTLHVPFPADFFLSNPSWSILSNQSFSGGYIRLNGPFSEPSAMAGYMTSMGCAASWVVLNGHKGWMPRVLALVSIFLVLLSTSATGYVASLLMAALALGWTVFRGPNRLRARLVQIYSGTAVAALLICVLVGAASPKIAKLATEVYGATVHKDQSSSYADRTQTDRDSYKEVWATHGLGVGWGSNRSSSLTPGLMAAIGIPGMIGLAWFGANLSRHVLIAHRLAVSEDHQYAMRAAEGGLLGALAAAVISGPTETAPDFYLLIGLLAATAARVQYEARVTRKVMYARHEAPALKLAGDRA